MPRHLVAPFESGENYEQSGGDLDLTSVASDWLGDCSESRRSTPMTTKKVAKPSKTADAPKRSKIALRKDTLKDLTAGSKAKARAVKGGAGYSYGLYSAK
jgi:hypothetical protein